jgi:hypothetical protein
VFMDFSGRDLGGDTVGDLSQVEAGHL